ncbi:hypothetical protein VQL36_05405 [Chengkuizengella sp. SCS-71B]|uniref:hypothetical protein n=1 Tax=Chengkuizengella sp. SCS-71B TaxID=3115290 RepID=UPI0032C230F5
MDLDAHIKEITTLRNKADKLIEDSPGALLKKIEILARCLVFIGRVSSQLDGDYKRIYAQRKYEYSFAEINAKSPKKAHAELAVKDLREKEAEAYQMMQRWRNAFSSTQEEIHALKLKMRIDFENSQNGG